jgi:hypothetical protein
MTRRRLTGPEPSATAPPGPALDHGPRQPDALAVPGALPVGERPQTHCAVPFSVTVNGVAALGASWVKLSVEVFAPAAVIGLKRTWYCT